MESVGSNSTPPPPDIDNHRPQPRFRPSQPVADRICRALRHDLRLLHRADSAIFFVLGATGNVYTVTLSTSPSCSCPDRITPCKHILFVYIRVLGLPLDDACLRRRTLSPYHLSRLLDMPVFNSDSLAGAGLRERFHELFYQYQRDNNINKSGINAGDVVEIKEDGSTCPICLEEMAGKGGGEGSGSGRRVVSCETCKNWIHEECFMRWKRSGGRRTASCVICRAKWRSSGTVEKYLNLGAYVNQEDDAQGDRNNGGGVRLCGG